MALEFDVSRTPEGTTVRKTQKKIMCVRIEKYGAPGEARTPDPLLRSRLSTFIKTLPEWRKAEENQQVVTTSDQLLAPSLSLLCRLFLTICHN